MSDLEASTARLFRGLGRGGSLNLIGAICQQASLLGTTAVIARVLGPGPLGSYVIAYAALTLLSLLSQFGFRAALTRFVAVHLAEADLGQVRSLVRFVAVVAGSVSVVVGAAAIVFSSTLADLFNNPDLSTGFAVVGAALPAFTFRDLALAAIQGFRTQRAFALIGWVYEPIVRFALTAVGLALGFGLAGAYGALLIGSWTAALAAVLALGRRLRPAPKNKSPVDARGVLSFSVASWWNTLAVTGLVWADTLLLGVLADTESVGTYTVATRLVSLAVFVMAPVDVLFAPHFAHFHHLGELGRLGSTYAAATNWILRLSLPAFVVLLAFPGDLLRLFGPGFVAGTVVTVVMAIGQLVNAATGPAGSILTMSGRVRLNLLINLTGLVINVVLNIVLIPAYGIVGAALAWSVSLVLLNLAKLSQVRTLTGLFPFGVVTAKSVAAAVAAAVVAVATKALLPGGPVTMVVGVVLVVLTYATVTLVLRFSTDELSLLKGVAGARSRG